MNTFSKRTETDLNECEHFLKASEIDLNECEHFLKANLHRSEIDLTWINLSLNGSLGAIHTSELDRSDKSKAI